MTQSQINQNEAVAEGYIVASANTPISKSEKYLFEDLKIETVDSKVEFKFASITQKIIEKISESQKNLISASSVDLNTDTK